MAKLSAAERSQTYNELAEATSPTTAGVIMQNVVDVQWDDLVTKDHLDARVAQVDVRFAQVDVRFARLEAKVDARFSETDAKVDARFSEMNAKFERSMRSNTFRILTTMFAFNGALVAAMAAFH